MPADSKKGGSALAAKSSRASAEVQTTIPVYETIESLAVLPLDQKFPGRSSKGAKVGLFLVG